MDSFFQKYNLENILEFVDTHRCKIGYIEKAIKFKENVVIRDKVALGLCDYQMEDRKELINRWFHESIETTKEWNAFFEQQLKKMETEGYIWDKSQLHLGKELHNTSWKSEIYIYHTHKNNPNSFGVSFDLSSHEYSHYEVLNEYWLYALIQLKKHLTNIEYDALTYVMGHLPDIRKKHLYKTDDRYLYNIYFSLFLPYQEVKEDVCHLVHIFTGQDFLRYEGDFVDFPILAMVHISQLVDGSRQFSLYFRHKDI